MGDFNVYYLTPREQQKLDTLLFLYGLTLIITKEPTRVKGQLRSLIGYLIKDHHFDCDSFTSFVSDSPRRTSKNEPIDQLATSGVSNIVNDHSKMFSLKKIR